MQQNGIEDPAQPPLSAEHVVKGKKPGKPQSPRSPEVKEPAPPLLSLFAQQKRLEQALKKRSAYAKGAAATGDRVIIEGSKDHHDLQSFTAFAEKNKLNPDTAVYKGTHYEYTVMESLKTFGFDLQRTGKSNDKGIDLRGHWNIPGKPHEIKVLVQCKVSRGTPSAARELEGAYAGAPSEWQGENVLALLASSKGLTKGVVEGVQRSTSPVGALQVDGEGLTRQFIWNAVAGERGLSGLGVTAKHLNVPSTPEGPKGAKQTLKAVVLTWKGKPFTVKPVAK